MTKIYDQHRAAFPNVSAYVVVGTNAKGEPDRKATIAFKYPRDGAGRLYCYLHVFGGPMVRAYAGGGGYDKHSAAASSAASRLNPADYYPESQADVEALKAALLPDDGYRWDSRVEKAGFKVFQAV